MLSSHPNGGQNYLIAMNSTSDVYGKLERLMILLKNNNPDMKWKMALEFRRPSLYVDEVYELLEKYGFALVIHDINQAVLL